MPTNVTAEYTMAEAKYREAKTTEEKIAALEEMLKAAPRHKGMSNVLAELKSKLAKLRKEQTKSSAKTAARKTITIPKEGEAQIAIVGLPNVGKSTLLNTLTGSNAKVADYPYTTVLPEVGMLEYNDVNLQIVEIPSLFTPEMVSIARSADIIIGLIAGDGDKEELKELLKGLHKKIFWLNRNNDIDTMKKRIWDYTGLIHVYTKTPGKKKDLPAITFHEGATVEDVAGKIHKEFVKRFRYARIFGPSAKFEGQQVGIEHKVKDGDVVEIHLK